MKTDRYCVPMCRVFALFALLCLFSGCAEDELISCTTEQGEKGMTLTFALPDPITIDPKTKVGAADFNAVTDLNVVIADGAEDAATITNIIYLDHTTPSPTLEGITVSYEEGRTLPSIHFDATVYPGEHIYVVANWKKKIDQTTVSNVSALKRLKQTATQGIPVGSVLFGKAEVVDGKTNQHAGKVMEAKLLRTVAMVTVVIDGTNLHEHVVITPTRVSLCNVPKSCSIGTDNMVTDNECEPVGESKMAGTMWLGQIGSGETTGKHYSTTAYNDEGVEPLFLFENLHGAGFGAEVDHQKDKRPNGVANNPTAIEEKSKNCSYLKVEANYHYKAKGKEISGDVAFKLFLGEDVLKNFDVKRNHYYKVTLSLSGMVVTEDGHTLNDDGTLQVSETNASWRIDSHLDQVTLLNGDIHINASGDFFFLELAGKDNVQWRITGDNTDHYFMWAYDSREYWGNFSQIGVSGTSIPKDGIMVFCDPWVSGEPSKQSQTIRLEIMENGSWKKVKSITVTQYAPIEVKFTNEQLPPALEFFADRKMYIDRIDRKAMPWGFMDTSFPTTDGTNGFSNAYDLVDPVAEWYQIANFYCPWGKANGGSAMIYAICLNTYPKQQPVVSPSELKKHADLPTLDELNNRYQDEYDYVWTIPSIAGWQVIEKFAKKEIDKSGFPIHSFNEYWTSNVVAMDDKAVNDSEGSKYAYYYRMGADFDKIKEGEPYPYYSLRSQSKLFRCIAVSQQ